MACRPDTAHCLFLPSLQDGDGFYRRAFAISLMIRNVDLQLQLSKILSQRKEFHSSPQQIVCVSHSVMSNSLQPYGLQPPGSSVHGIFQIRILEWIAIPFSIARGLPLPSPWDHPDPGIEPGSPALQADSSPSEPPGRSLSGLVLP